jgi:phage tail tape-measure protein
MKIMIRGVCVVALLGAAGAAYATNQGVEGGAITGAAAGAIVAGPVGAVVGGVGGAVVGNHVTNKAQREEAPHKYHHHTHHTSETQGAAVQPRPETKPAPAPSAR